MKPGATLLDVPEMFEALLQVIPTAVEEWQAYLVDFQDEPAYFIGIGTFSHAIAELFEAGKTESFSSVFSVVEEFLVRGNEQVRGLVSVGFLESLQNNLSWTKDGYSRVEPWFGPETLKTWKELEELWRGKSSLMDVIRDGKSN
jgi:hypothetical protein